MPGVVAPSVAFTSPRGLPPGRRTHVAGHRVLLQPGCQGGHGKGTALNKRNDNGLSGNWSRGPDAASAPAYLVGQGPRTHAAIGERFGDKPSGPKGRPVSQLPRSYCFILR